MCGYQGWFSCAGDPVNAGWFHYPRDNKVEPGYIGIDFYPDMTEYEKKYVAPGFKYADGSQAYLFSSADSSTVDLHFKWMRDYGIDGVFIQRFVSQTTGGTGKKRVNMVLDYALKAAKKYNRAIAVMYDGGIDNETQYNRITSDWNEIVAEFDLFNPQKNPTFLRHNGKPVFALWGYGVNSRGYDPVWFDNLCAAIKGEVEKKVSIMIGTPYYWREQVSDCVPDASYHPSLKKWVDIISPWAVGRYRSNNVLLKVEQQVQADLAWCNANQIDYVPVAFPGFSWQNMKGGDNNPYDDYPRQKGNFLWNQVATAKTKGADKLYIAMFDEMDEGTCIFMCETHDRLPLNGSGRFVGYDNDLGSDYYLWLSGQATNWFHGQTGYNATKPVRAAVKTIYLSASGNDNNSGLSPLSPVVTLTRALGIAANDDTIKVSGFIDVSTENTHVNGVSFPNLKITLDGGDAAISGFTGGNSSRILDITGNNNACVLKNLTFKQAGAAGIANGMAVSLTNSNTIFEHCVFIDNTGNTANGNGTLYLKNAAGAVVKNCIFKNNKVRFGGGVYIDGGRAEITGSVFEDMDLSDVANSAGGAVYISNAANVTLKNSILRNNKTALDGTAVYLRENNQAGNLVSNVRIEGCLITGNESVNRGGAALAMYNTTAGNVIHLAVINTTVYKNGTASVNNGGAFLFDSARTGSTVDLVNCTITDNYTGGNAGHGAGFRFFSNNNDDTSCKNLIKRISNCIIESNIAAQHPNQGSDISNRFDAIDGEDLFINNSYIGFILDNNGPYVQVPQSINRIGYQLAGLAGLSAQKDSFIIVQNSIPLEFDSDALEYGNAQYLKDFGVNTDQLGNTRSFANNRCAIGAVEVPAEPVYDGEPKDYTHLIMYGQSLATGHESHVTLSAENVPGNYMIGSQVWINYGNADLKTLNPLVGSRAKNAADIIESPLLGAANHIRLKELHPDIIATSAGTSGKPIEDLSKESQVSVLYDDYLNTLKSAYKIARRSNSALTCPALFWLQGEWNYQGYGNGLTGGSTPTFDKDEYKALMITLKNNMQNDAKTIYSQTEAPVFYTYQVGAQYSKGKELTIGMAQLEASNEYPDVICAGPVYPMTDVGGHLDANGYRWYGEMLGKVYYKTQIAGEDFKPLQPLELLRDNADPKKVIVKFLVPEMPLVLDEKTLAKATDYGFEVYNDNIRQIISSVEIQGDCVILACVQNLTGKIEVAYAGANVSTRGHGNLRDSDPYTAVFTYQDLDKKDGEGNYVYPRNPNDASPTLRPGFEPKDAAGNIIYEQPYPLYNFSLSFYYAIPAGEQKYVVPHLSGTTGLSVAGKESKLSIVQYGKKITVHAPGQKSLNVAIADVSGKLCARFSGKSNRGEFDLSHLPDGYYIVRITSATETKTYKIILNDER
jgi:hypothetical protein